MTSLTNRPITRMFLSFLLLTILCHLRTSAQASTCLPDGFAVVYGSPICMGYAQARAFGCSDAVALTVHNSTIDLSFFTRVTSSELLPGVMAGDILLWSSGGFPTVQNGHAAYVVSMDRRSISGKIRVGSDGEGGDINPPVDVSQVVVAYVTGDDGESIQAGSYVALNDSRKQKNPPENFYGAYRLKRPDETPTPATYMTIFRNVFTTGQINVGKSDTTWINKSSPDTGLYAFNATIPARAINQKDNATGINYAWNQESNWSIGGVVVETYVEYEHTVTKDPTTVVANLSQVSPTTYVEFENRFGNVSIGGVIKVAGVDRKSPTDPHALSVTAEAYQTLEIDRVTLTFLRWEKNGALFSTSRIITPAQAGKYIAMYSFNYILPPAEINPFNNSVGQPVKITWLGHSSSFADRIQIWRKVKNVHAPMVIAELAGNSTEFTDWEVTVTDGYTDDLVDYDVRVRYSLNQTYSSPSWFSLFGDHSNAKTLSSQKKGERDSFDGTAQSGAQSSFSVYPNPFNPATTFEVNLAKTSHVEIEVFSITGAIVMSHGSKVWTAGRHSIAWNASDPNRAVLPSGVYVVRFAAFPVDGSSATVKFARAVLLR